MNANTYTHFKNQLLKMKEQAEANARILDDFQERSMKDATGELSFIDNHPSDYAFETERREVEGTLLRFENEQIHHINEALFLADKMLVLGKNKYVFIDNPQDYTKEQLLKLY